MLGLTACDSIAALQAHRWPAADDFDYSHIHPRDLEVKAQDMVVSAGHIGLGYQMHNMLRGSIRALYDVTDPAYMEVYTAMFHMFYRAQGVDYTSCTVFVYYGGADRVMGVATCALTDLLQRVPMH